MRRAASEVALAALDLAQSRSRPVASWRHSPRRGPATRRRALPRIPLSRDHISPPFGSARRQAGPGRPLGPQALPLNTLSREHTSLPLGIAAAGRGPATWAEPPRRHPAQPRSRLGAPWPRPPSGPGRSRRPSPALTPLLRARSRSYLAAPRRRSRRAKPGPQRPSQPMPARRSRSAEIAHGAAPLQRRRQARAGCRKGRALPSVSLIETLSVPAAPLQRFR